MKTKFTKEIFIERLIKDNKHRNDLLKFRNRIFLPLLQKFHGKVYNIRFIKALREANLDELIYIHELKNITNHYLCIALNIMSITELWKRLASDVL